MNKLGLSLALLLSLSVKAEPAHSFCGGSVKLPTGMDLPPAGLHQNSFQRFLPGHV